MTNPIKSTAAPVRRLGHDFSLYSGKARAYLRHKRIPFAQWMFQRPLVHYQSLTDEQKSCIDPILDRLGGLDGLNEPVVAPLKFEDYRIRLVR